MKKMLMKWLPKIAVVVIGMIVWTEVAGLYVKARAAVLKTAKGA